MKIIENGIVRDMTEEEVQRYESLTTPDVPSQIDILEAQLLYTAIMTDTLIEGE